MYAVWFKDVLLVVYNQLSLCPLSALRPTRPTGTLSTTSMKPILETSASFPSKSLQTPSCFSDGNKVVSLKVRQEQLLHVFQIYLISYCKTLFTCPRCFHNVGASELRGNTPHKLFPVSLPVKTDGFLHHDTLGSL